MRVVWRAQAITANPFAPKYGGQVLSKNWRPVLPKKWGTRAPGRLRPRGRRRTHVSGQELAGERRRLQRRRDRGDGQVLAAGAGDFAAHVLELAITENIEIDAHVGAAKADFVEP